MTSGRPGGGPTPWGIKGFSKKDRAALGVIEEAEASGVLTPGQTVVELTSGNMGTGLAIVCAIKGYPFVAVMSKGNSQERARMMRALGADVILVDQLPGSVPGQVSGGDLALVEQIAKNVSAERGAFRADQFNRDGNWLAHYHKTGPEIWGASHGVVDAFVDFIGSGGTYVGVTKALKERNPSIKCFVVKPEGVDARQARCFSR
ncbi:pyridoxal-phosphate dependent enzyme [Mesorhizobium opportunistum]|uniref:Pyridoxal-phosphate dependent enzyme n=1 Tax=Mesorhizobium opportunistum TaxID=593909 RepID=A0ABV1YPA9_9HYPH|nr:pyridoxal-phosphate dependent enzyme [Mesorhizobium sp.]